MKQTKNGMRREDKGGKINPLDYTTVPNELRYAAHMLKGALKHGSGNWKKGGYDLIHWCESARRHLLAMECTARGESVPDILGGNNEDHAAALRFNAEGFMHEQYLQFLATRKRR